mmetsp:Transcript_14643/g.31380  ORF Transcript_14643/g.31380 Transcript_14643/m.31380 type:complete len:120 (+) Transcript_14643:432-791(+)|eukprot:CAMPEP_0118922126 /NCGR_PEP_ID=MMETSP1169-20130426/1160_1 /TAXON_ID=36882 /ORGANISM="Pyramimonas obovata, Strain CCMP722" /LENGTH=119 /DNA_ID=CAMNT_0006862953 /DNA_START=414 /DNA_END=773 /DNA_ORIENTATION=+
MAATDTCASIRFRMQDGNDIGPMPVNIALSVLAVKEKLIQEWSKDPTKEGPKSTADMKLILAGQVLNNTRLLSDLRMPTTPDTVVTMHLVIRPPAAAKSRGENSQGEVEKVSKCSCLIV